MVAGGGKKSQEKGEVLFVFLFFTFYFLYGSNNCMAIYSWERLSREGTLMM